MKNRLFLVSISASLHVQIQWCLCMLIFLKLHLKYFDHNMLRISLTWRGGGGGGGFSPLSPPPGSDPAFPYYSQMLICSQKLIAYRFLFTFNSNICHIISPPNTGCTQFLGSAWAVSIYALTLSRPQPVLFDPRVKAVRYFLQGWKMRL